MSRYTSTLPRPLDTDAPDTRLQASIGTLLEALEQARRERDHARQALHRQRLHVEALHRQLRQARGTIERLATWRRPRPARHHLDLQLPLALEVRP
jgi:chromosome segregation ATPase